MTLTAESMIQLYAVNEYVITFFVWKPKSMADSKNTEVPIYDPAVVE